MSKKTESKRIDWEAVERDYRVSRLTVEEIAKKHGTTKVSVFRHIKEGGWQRDLSDVVRAATSAKLIEHAVNDINKRALLEAAKQEAGAKAEQETTNAVMAMAEVQTGVIIRHRAALSRLTSVRDNLLSQIEAAVPNCRNAKERSGLIEDLRKVTDIDARLRAGEREAYAISEDPGKSGERSIEELLQQLGESLK